MNDPIFYNSGDEFHGVGKTFTMENCLSHFFKLIQNFKTLKFARCERLSVKKSRLVTETEKTSPRKLRNKTKVLHGHTLWHNGCATISEFSPSQTNPIGVKQSKILFL